MEPRPPEPPPSSSSAQVLSHMDLHAPPLLDDSAAADSVWDFGDLLDFTADDHLVIPWDEPPVLDNPASAPSDPDPDPSPEDPADDAPVATRVRKRDPRLVCSNFLAGRVPCACPELDAMMEEEEEAEGLHKKKRTRAPRGAGQGMARCQVPTCKADIRELKGYHRRHRVCLRCANASAVVLDGERKRYCQQCGKFHILSDFDEGKRSCRRKLERHNKRRRRKPVDSGGELAKELQQDIHSEDVGCDDEDGKDTLCLSGQFGEKEASLEPEDGGVPTPETAPECQIIPTDSIASYVVSRETQMKSRKDNSKCALSPSYGDNRSAYSSVCPTGRISFKLYDWNPAEFPRRLRHQIFQWLASMPVELEGYIRPGCIILTLFIAMPKLMWGKLYEDPVSHINDFLLRPGRMLSGRGTIYILMNDMVFHLMKDESSVAKVEMGVRTPRLHYVHPMYFEAGKPMEFVACGSDLLQPHFRFLISFAGKYLACDYGAASSYSGSERGINCNSDHQLYNIHIPCNELNQCGPAFIEVENQFGLSNFIPILIGNKEVCSEMRMIQQKVDKALLNEGLQISNIGNVLDSCGAFSQRRTTLSEFVLDIAWLLKEPVSENLHHIPPVSQIQRFSSLLSFLMHHDSSIVLEKILQKLDILMENIALTSESSSGKNNDDIRLLNTQIDQAREFLRKHQSSKMVVLRSEHLKRKEECSHQGFPQNDVLSAVTIASQDMERGECYRVELLMGSNFTNKNEAAPLLDVELVMNGNLLKEKPRNRVLLNSVMRSRPALYVVATAAVCFGVCAVLLHPDKVGEFAVSIHRSLFDRP
ncbi:squamosa promoter-binding-like protein 7 [Rhodamnia argentea]|uniref:Squamosa promoter-binding-like protein 7 n=1 Tax=Rhodamnia argentea TaxID=178133 RepID=A0A8B8Q196_9MYRT|nr:squamosa promoter-binding-like protein 7 [Rhodamnia argentea]